MLVSLTVRGVYRTLRCCGRHFNEVEEVSTGAVYARRHIQLEGSDSISARHLEEVQNEVRGGAVHVTIIPQVNCKISVHGLDVCWMY